MFNTTTNISKKLQYEFVRKYLAAAGACLTVGTAGVLIYILRQYVFELPAEWQKLFLIFAFPLGLGVLLSYLTAKTLKTTTVDERDISYSFAEKGVTVVTKRADGEKSEEISYGDVVRAKQTKNFIFFYLKNNDSYPVDKRNLSKDELAELKNKLNFPKK